MSEDSSSNYAFEETLELLEWPILCNQLSTFAITAQCRIKCRNLKFPSNIETSRDLIKETIEIGSLDQFLEGGLNFKGIHDLKQTLLRCLKGGVVTGEELLHVAETLRCARKLRRQIDEPFERPITTKLLAQLSTLPELQKLLEFGIEEGGRVADRASPKLSELRRKANRCRLERNNLLHDLMRRFSSSLQDNVISQRYGRPVLAVKAFGGDQIKGVVHDSSASGSTLYVEPQSVISMGNRIAEGDAKIFEEEQLLLRKWSTEVGENFSTLKVLCEIMLRLELALTRARYTNWLGAVAPTLNLDPNTPIKLNNFRHPLLIWQERREDGESVVPISLEVSSSIKVVAITGPNTGGKTVALKSIGLALLMARAGLFLPCDGQPILPWCKQVLADIGDEQSLQQNLSTFSGHIMRICQILTAIERYKGTTIVLLDEVGAGTDPTEGTALAIALLTTLAARARLTIATTHFGELKALKYSDSRFENASVAFDSETITPRYHLLWGIPGKSNALSIAKRLGLDSQIISHAHKLISPQGVADVNQVIRGLEEQRERQQAAAEDAAFLLARTELLHDELLEQWKQQSKKSAEIEEQERHKLESSIREGQKEVRALIKRLRDQGASGETARRAGKRLRELSSNSQPISVKENIQDWQPKIGDRVRLTLLGKAGEVVDVSTDGLQLTVLCGIFRSKVDLSGVESLDGRKAKSVFTRPKVNTSISTSISSIPSVRTKKNTLDIRGLRVHEAESVVEDKLRHASGPIWVIHGIGTGKLKRGIREWLETVSYVDKVIDADQQDGGAGCSVVWIR